MKLRDDAMFYSETLRELGVEDPLGGETAADKALREASAKHDANMRALKEVVASDWSKEPVAARRPKRKR